MKPVGLVRMNAEPGAGPGDATILVSGPPWSGIAFVVAALRAAGLDVVDADEFAAALPPRWRLTRTTDWPAVRRIDSAALRRLVATQAQTQRPWGVARANIEAALVMRSGSALLRRPRLVMIFRDPIAMAQGAAAEGRDFAEALALTRRDNDRNLRIARDATIPVLLVSYEKVMVQRDVFFADLFDFCGLAVEPGDYARIGQAVDGIGARLPLMM